MGHEGHGSCSHGSCSHGTGSQGSSSCGCGSQNCKCCCHHQCKCSCHQQCKYADELLHLADDAWMEVLKEKIKEEIRQNANDQISQLAKLVSSANHARWRDKMQAKRDNEDFENQLKNLLINKK